MSGKKRIAIPSLSPGGMEAVSSTHFGKADCFTLVEIEGKNIVDVKILENPPHEHGGCMAPVLLLKDNDVNIIIVGGMGMRPMMGFQEVGIQVYAGAMGTIDFAINEFLEGRLEAAGDDVICGHSREGNCHES